MKKKYQSFGRAAVVKMRTKRLRDRGVTSERFIKPQSGFTLNNPRCPPAGGSEPGGNTTTLTLDWRLKNCHVIYYFAGSN